MGKAIQVNGQRLDWKQNLTVEKILESIDFGYRLFIVKVDDEIIKKEHYGSRSVAAGASVRVIPILPGG